MTSAGLRDSTPGASRDVLIVDDDNACRELMVEVFSGSGYRCHAAINGADGVRTFEAVSPALVITDVKMPVMDGIEFLRRVLILDPDAAVIVLTGFGDVPMAVESLRMGAYHFVLKPVNVEEILIVAVRALERRELKRARRDYDALLNRRIAEATGALSEVASRLEAAYTDLLTQLGSREGTLGGSQTDPRRVEAYAAEIAEALDQSAEDIAAIRQAALFRDIGYLMLPSLVHAGGPDRQRERAIEAHPVIGRRLLEPVPQLRAAAALVQAHHERWDGTGYPDGLRADAIPLGARILAVAEALDEAISRSNGDRSAIRAALTQIDYEAGRRFDPAIVHIVRWMPIEKLERVGSQFAAPSRQTA